MMKLKEVLESIKINNNMDTIDIIIRWTDYTVSYLLRVPMIVSRKTRMFKNKTIFQDNNSPEERKDRLIYYIEDKLGLSNAEVWRISTELVPHGTHNRKIHLGIWIHLSKRNYKKCSETIKRTARGVCSIDLYVDKNYWDNYIHTHNNAGTE